MSNLDKTPRSILDQILDEMFLKLEEEDKFSSEDVEEIRQLVNTNSLIKGDNLLNLLKEEGDEG